MATDAQGRQLSEDGFYYWDGTAWQLVQQDGATQDGAAQGATAPDAAAQSPAGQPTGAGQDAAEKTPTADDFHAAMNFETTSEISAV